MLKVAKKTIDLIKETLFPLFCICCEKEGAWICNECYVNFESAGIFLCPVCKAPTIFGKVCVDCKKKAKLSSVISIFNFKKNPDIDKIIYIWKYLYAEELVKVVDGFVQDFIQSNFILFADVDAIVPVPLHSRRFAERGFNQAEEIAKSISEILDIPVVNILKRKRYTKQQAKLKKSQRTKNVVNAFVPSKYFKKYKKVLLVDDVFTTGSTMNECSRVLLYNGIEKVNGFVLVRG